MIKKLPLDIQNIIKIKFNDEKLLKRSLTHKSYSADENNEKIQQNWQEIYGKADALSCMR